MPHGGASKGGKVNGQLEPGNEDRDSDETLRAEHPRLIRRNEEDGWKLSKKTGKMFCMGQDSDRTKLVKTEIVVQCDIQGVIASAFLDSEYSPTVHLECTRAEIERLEQFFGSCTIYNDISRRDGFLLPFSYDNFTMKFRNNDPKWRGVPFTSIQDKRGQVLETKDITTGAVVCISSSPVFL
jgi:hypothetical protein